MLLKRSQKLMVRIILFMHKTFGRLRVLSEEAHVFHATCFPKECFESADVVVAKSVDAQEPWMRRVCVDANAFIASVCRSFIYLAMHEMRAPEAFIDREMPVVTHLVA